MAIKDVRAHDDPAALRRQFYALKGVCLSLERQLSELRECHALLTRALSARSDAEIEAERAVNEVLTNENEFLRDEIERLSKSAANARGNKQEGGNV